MLGAAAAAAAYFIYSIYSKGGSLGGSHTVGFPGGQAAEEARWEIPYLKHEHDAREFYGYKPCVNVTLSLGHSANVSPADYLKSIFGAPAGHIQVGAKWWTQGLGTAKLMASSGRLYCPKSYRFKYAGKIKDSIVGDPRALYALDALMRVSGLTTLEHMGLNNPNTSSDFGHQSGCAIDIPQESDFVKLLNAANKVNMPVVAIMKAASGPWRINKWARWDKSLPGPVPKFLHTTKIPHRDHFHLILPRPNLVEGYFKRTAPSAVLASGPPPIGDIGDAI